MASQPADEHNVRHFTPSVDRQTAQYSRDTPERPVLSVNLSASILKHGSSDSIVGTFDEDCNGSEESLQITPDMEEKLDQMVRSGEGDLPHWGSDESNDWLIKELDRTNLAEVDRSIENRTMYVASQPPSDIRRRYLSDGKRQIEKSRSSPMAIKLPDLTRCRLDSYHSFWLELVLITSTANPSGKAYFHVYKLEYHTNDPSECMSEVVRVPLTDADIQGGIKQLPRVSIIKSKLDAYTFALKPYDPMVPDTQLELYENASKTVVAKAKVFRDKYQLQSSRIACQLLIKQDTTWRRTDIVCETDIMEEKAKPVKRPAPTDDLAESDDDYPEPRQKRGKKRKQSSTSTSNLPVTRMRSACSHPTE